MLFCASDGKSWRFSQWNVAKKVNNFLYSRYFLPILALLAVIGHVFAIEMCIYWVYVAIMLYVCLFGRDFLLLLPVTVNCYIMPSHLNNPGKHAESIFFMENGAYQFVIMAALLLSAAIFRMIFDREIGFRNIKRVKFKLLWGMLALCAAYLLSGVGSENFVQNFGKNIRFALLQCIAVIVLYFILSFSVKWDECDRRYLCYVLVLMGLVIGVEVLNIYQVNQILAAGTLNKDLIYVGWGISNNIGMHIALAIPAAFYFVYKGEGVIFYNFVAVLLCLFTVMTASRAAILGACALYGLCVVAVILKGKRNFARILTPASAVLFASAALYLVIDANVLKDIFYHGLQSSSRLDLYNYGMQLFAEKPVFGNGFFCMNDYHLDSTIWDKVAAFAEGFPDRWHNTVIQLLVSCGAVGLGAYLFHRYQTVKLFFTKRSAEKLFVGASLALILLLSLVDCHFYNIGPVLIYSAALAFVEGVESQPISL